MLLCVLKSTFILAFTCNVPVCARESNAPSAFFLSFFRIAFTCAFSDALLTVACKSISFRFAAFTACKSFAKKVHVILLFPVFSFLPFTTNVVPFFLACIRFAIITLSVALLFSANNIAVPPSLLAGIVISTFPCLFTVYCFPEYASVITFPAKSFTINVTFLLVFAIFNATTAFSPL